LGNEDRSLNENNKSLDEQLNDKGLELVGKYISIIYRSMNCILDKQLAVYDIDRGQFPFLIPLYRHEGISQKELCEFYNMDKAAAVRALNKLEIKDYVMRKKDPEDKRQHQLFLTNKAKEFKPQLFKIIKYTENRMLENINEEEIGQLKNILKKISSNLGVEKGGKYNE